MKTIGMEWRSNKREKKDKAKTIKRVQMGDRERERETSSKKESKTKIEEKKTNKKYEVLIKAKSM